MERTARLVKKRHARRAKPGIIERTVHAASHERREVTPVKAALRGFQHDIDALQPDGETALWDAVELAVAKLVAFAESERRRDPANCPANYSSYVAGLGVDARDRRRHPWQARAAVTYSRDTLTSV